MKKGIGLSSDLIQACSLRGIRIHVCDWRGQVVSSVLGHAQHAVVNVRRQQFQFVDSSRACLFAKELISSKLFNQRAVLLYFAKNSNLAIQTRWKLRQGASEIAEIRYRVIDFQNMENWREIIMGNEGYAATIYWDALRKSTLLPDSFRIRQGRYAKEVVNQALNYGYALLESYVRSALDNAGLELYLGVLHTSRPGKPSLVLDVMERYRAWVVDRNIIKLRSELAKHRSLTSHLKKRIAMSIHETMARKHYYRSKKLRLDVILQRQVYRMTGQFFGELKYRGFHVKW